MNQPKLVSVEKDTTTLGELDPKKFVIFKTRELAGFLKYVHDIVSTDANRAKELVAGFLTELAQKIKE